MGGLGKVGAKDTYVSYEQLSARIPEGSVDGWVRRGCHLDNSFDIIIRGCRSGGREGFGRRGRGRAGLLRR